MPVGRTIKFYAALFKQNSKLDWPAVTKVAMEFEPIIKKKWPAYWDEMRGIADGSGHSLEDIIAVNVRTEINFGLWKDGGCTALAWKSEEAGASYLAQNWDWEEGQAPNIIFATITNPPKPTIKMVTEAGIIGKIGLNSAGVGICLNALRAPGMDVTRIPCHLGLRLALECSSKDEALTKLEKFGVASSCHYLLADGATGGIGLEWSPVDLKRIPQDSHKRVFHSNHYIKPHGPHDVLVGDSPARLKRIEKLSDDLGEDGLGFDGLFDIFKDEDGYPGSICRKQQPPKTTSSTLFNIIMELESKKARVTMGRPTEGGERTEFVF